MRRPTNDFVHLPKDLALIVYQHFGVTDQIDEENVRDSQLEIWRILRGHFVLCVNCDDSLSARFRPAFV